MSGIKSSVKMVQRQVKPLPAQIQDSLVSLLQTAQTGDMLTSDAATAALTTDRKQAHSSSSNYCTNNRRGKLLTCDVWRQQYSDIPPNVVFVQTSVGTGL